MTDVEEPGKLPDQPFEEVQLVFNGISWTHEIGGVTYVDSWKAGEGGKYPASGSSGAAGASPAAAGGAAGAAGSSQSGRAEVALAVPIAAPERLRSLVVERRAPSRVATRGVV